MDLKSMTKADAILAESHLTHKQYEKLLANLSADFETNNYQGQKVRATIYSDAVHFSPGVAMTRAEALKMARWLTEMLSEQLYDVSEGRANNE